MSVIHSIYGKLFLANFCNGVKIALLCYYLVDVSIIMSTMILMLYQFNMLNKTKP